MDVLDQVAARIRLGFIAARQPLDGSAELLGRRRVALILFCLLVQRRPRPLGRIDRRVIGNLQLSAKDLVFWGLVNVRSHPGLLVRPSAFRLGGASSGPTLHRRIQTFALGA